MYVRAGKTENARVWQGMNPSSPSNGLGIMVRQVCGVHTPLEYQLSCQRAATGGVVVAWSREGGMEVLLDLPSGGGRRRRRKLMAEEEDDDSPFTSAAALAVGM